MPENIIAEIRQMLEETVALDLKAIAIKLDSIQEHIQRLEASMISQLDALRAELIALRSEMRPELPAQRNLLSKQSAVRDLPDWRTDSAGSIQN
jgi:hypothetical protein